MPEDLIKPISDFWKVAYTHKFYDIDLDIVKKMCLDEGIYIFCVNNWSCERGFETDKYKLKYYLDKSKDNYD